MIVFLKFFSFFPPPPPPRNCKVPLDISYFSIKITWPQFPTHSSSVALRDREDYYSSLQNI
jgi:hypothetical protein